jgi:hypothetical protein
MRIAICFSGEVRTGVSASPNVLRFIGDLISVTDFFIHTWDINTIRCCHEGCRIDNAIIPALDLDEFCSIYKPKYVHIDDQMKIVRQLQKKDKPKEVGEKGWTHRFYSWKQSIDYKKNYEILHNFKYDIVIKLRPDIIFSADIRLIDLLPLIKENTFAIDHFIDPGGTPAADDAMFIATSSTMDRVYDWNDFISAGWILPGKVIPYLDPNVGLMDFIRFKDCVPYDLKIQEYVSIYRPECLHFDPISEYGKCADFCSIFYRFGIPITDHNNINLSLDEIEYFEQLFLSLHLHTGIKPV